MHKGYRIISVEAADLYKHEQENGVAVGYKPPEVKSNAYYWLFKNKLDYSLDSIELEKAYTRICRKKFSSVDEHNNNYTLAVVNVKFNYTYKAESGEAVSLKKLREHFYEEGFNIEGIHYVRYKRSAGSSREGTCLFIDERLYKSMAKWSECGLVPKNDLASWESYKSLSLSSIIGTIDIPLDGILFVPDYKSTFTDEVVSVELQDGELIAEEKKTEITNDIWDGESLLDESLFTGEWQEKHMLLLRNKFFKSCAFKTKLQKWIQDKGITLEDLKERGFITLAENVNQIVMVTTPNSLKYLKFTNGFTEKNIRKWVSNVNPTFGVVKTDKRTKYFGGRMVQSSYQLLNTVFLSEKKCAELLQSSIDYISLIRNDISFMRYHFSEAYAREHEEAADDEAEEVYHFTDRADIIFKILKRNPEFQNTKLYINFRNSVVKNLKQRIKQGKILLSGTSATLFGNGLELLQYIAGDEMQGPLQNGQVRCARFKHGQKLLGARSPHITMGNIYLAENNLEGGIWDYFDLGENIICVNAVNENIQQCLNGCDYDSDIMLVTDNELLINAMRNFYREFKVPVCNIPSGTKENQTLSELDYRTSNNKVGDIVNLSQRLNSLIWDMVIRRYIDDEVEKVYYDVCKLAVLSGIEIDKAKRAYDNVNVGKELNKIRNKYYKINPSFFKEIEVSEAEDKEYENYYTPMEHIYRIANVIKFHSGRNHKNSYESAILDVTATAGTSTDYRHRDRIISICEEYKLKLNQAQQAFRLAPKAEREVAYENILELQAELDRQISKYLTNQTVAVLVIRYFEQKNVTDWRMYEPIISNPVYLAMIAKNGYPVPKVKEDADGEYDLYGIKFTKIS